MSPIRKHTAYKLSLMVWVLVAFGAALFVASGNAEPYVSLSDVPTGTPFPLFGGAIVAVVLGIVVVGRVSRRDWKRAGRQANLSPVEDGGSGKPPLEGTVRGRTVRTRTFKRTRPSHDDSPDSATTYTVVEVDLTDPVDNGIIIKTTEDATVFGGGVQFEDHATDVDGFGVIGAEESFARAVLTNEVREELQNPSTLDSVFVGDVSDPLMAAVRDNSGLLASKLYDQLEEKIEETIFADETTVRVEQKGVLLDGTELTRRVDALVAVAESFESAQGRPESTVDGG